MPTDNRSKKERSGPISLNGTICFLSEISLNGLLIIIAAMAILALERVIAEDSKRLSYREMFCRDGRTNYPIRYVTISTETNFPIRMVTASSGTNYVMRSAIRHSEQTPHPSGKNEEIIPEVFIPTPKITMTSFSGR